MCGIIGYLGKEGLAINSVLDALGHLENRGYDSMGAVFVFSKGENEVYKISREEKFNFNIADLKAKVADKKRLCNLGIGHTRWSTCGKPTNANAHPQCDEDKTVYVVHNGNVLNFDELKKSLGECVFRSETDTEVIANLVAREYGKSKDLRQAAEKCLSVLEGANAFLVVDAKNPDLLVAANKSGTIILGEKEGASMVASEPGVLDLLGVKNRQVMETGATAQVVNGGWKIVMLDERKAEQPVQADLRQYPHQMLKEIFEQPGILERALRGRLVPGLGISKLGGIEPAAKELSGVPTFHFVGCGTAYHAALFAERLLQRLGINARSWVASEFCSYHACFDPKDAFVFISQSGETADTIKALAEVKLKQNLCLGIVNVEGSRIAREAGRGIYVQAGREIGVASTKAFTAQLSTIVLLAMYLARQRRMTSDTAETIIAEMIGLPEKIKSILTQASELKTLAEKYSAYKGFFFLGRAFNSVTADEGALKLKEITYLCADSYPLGEMKHGPLALIDENFVSVVIIPDDSLFSESLVSIREIKARGGKVLAITNTGMAKNLCGLADDVVEVPKTLEYLSPILTIIPLQLFAYYMAVKLGYNPDKPRNLAKTVTTQ
jgi:glucosamine--fructose-6-phosphate aminotransferase (isomerizing)